MKLKRFRVQMYKCVLDSGWIEMSNLTVLVGKNEAGKTSLLRALHKFNPFEPESYSIPREWPRGQRGERSDSQVVCSVEFELNAQEIADLKHIVAPGCDLSRLVVTRDYAGRFDVQFPKSVFAEKLLPNDVAHKKAHDYVIKSLPTFVYMDEYSAFRGTASLDQVKQRKDQGKLTADDQTLITMLRLAELDLDRDVQKLAQQDIEERQYDLSDAAATLNRKIEDHWKQMRYEVDFRADGPQFMTFVKTSKDKSLIRLEERSRGFQWFFSFDLLLMHETKGTLKNCAILLDEPGLHLHPTAQVDLLRRLSEYAKDNTVIYTTHLPFMIDVEYPERIRVVRENPQGTTVNENLADTDPEARLVLQAALGMPSRINLPIAEQNLIVESIDDYWILTALSDLSLRSSKPGLPLEVLVTPAGGISEITYVATFMIGQNVEVLALYDTDPAGNQAREKFLKNWLPRYKGRKANALSLGSAAGVANKVFSIEDLFPEDFYLSCVEEIYGKQLVAAGANFKILPHAEQLVKRVEKLFEGTSLSFNKTLVSKVLCRKIRAMKSISEVRSTTVSHVEILFENIRKEFAAFQSR